MKQKRLAVIGGGASGFAAAIEACYNNPLIVTIFDKQPKVCKKILATGNGRCNFSNTDLSPSHFYGERDFLRKILTSPFADDESFFREIGVLAYCEDGRLYPKSQQATTIREALIDKATQYGVNIVTDTAITNITKTSNGYIVNNEHFDAVILCGGGKASAPQDADTSCYELAKKLRHSTTALYPGLCGLTTKDKALTLLKGVRCKGTVSLYCDNTFIDSEHGEIQFTDKGISGIPVMNLSHYCKNSSDIKLMIDLCDDVSKEELRIYSEGIKASAPEKETELMLNGLVNNKLGYVIMDRASIKPHTRLKDLSNNKLNAVIDEIKSFEVVCTGTRGFENAQITCGGINTDEINPTTMMSEFNEGLFICGELLNIHGDCGGYNLHLAWTTGRIAGNSAADFLER